MSVVIIDAEYLADELVQATNWFALHFNLEPPITYTKDCGKKVAPLVISLIDDLITARLNWGNGQTENHLTEFKKLAPWFDYQGTSAISQAYFEKIYDDFYCRIDDLIGQAVPRRTWFQWTVTRTASGVVIEKGRDHRVVEWERLTDYKSPRRPIPPNKHVKPPVHKKRAAIRDKTISSI